MSEFLETVIKADAGHVWRVLDEFMDALKEARPDVYNDLVHSFVEKIGKCVLKCVLLKKNTVDFNESTVFFQVGVDGIRTHGLWSRNQARYQLRYTKKSAATLLLRWLGMRESNSHKRSQSPSHYHYANPHCMFVKRLCFRAALNA